MKIFLEYLVFQNKFSILLRMPTFSLRYVSAVKVSSGRYSSDNSSNESSKLSSIFFTYSPSYDFPCACLNNSIRLPGLKIYLYFFSIHTRNHVCMYVVFRFCVTGRYAMTDCSVFICTVAMYYTLKCYMRGFPLKNCRALYFGMLYVRQSVFL